jgi:23S rRNA G2445 N2-methylase RlmL
MLATAVPGLRPLLSDELAGLPGVEVVDGGFDGRADVVLFQSEPTATAAVLGLRLCEDVFVEIGRTLRSEGDRPDWIAGRLWGHERARRALDVRSTVAGPAARRATYRVITRVLTEGAFRRTELRRELVRVIGRDLPEWRPADPARIEVWAMEYRPGRFVAALRLSGRAMRQHDGRAQERAGALRPTVAAAMVRLAGTPSGTVLDPCCGAGTILAEAVAAGWAARGLDIDPEAVAAARRNAPSADVERGDARDLPMEDSTMDAVVSNLPFGRRYEVADDFAAAALSELARVTRPGGRVVLLAPTLPRAATPAALTLTERHPLRLLGTRTALWAYNRT